MRSYKAARRAAKADPVTFEYTYVAEEKAPDGGKVEVDKTTVFTCHGELSSLMLSEFAYHADLDVADPEGMSIVRQFFAEAFGDEEEYRRFFRLHTRYGDDDLLMDIIGGLVEDFAGRPTRRASSSPSTPSTTGPTSRDDSWSPEQEADVVVLPGGFRVQRPTNIEEHVAAMESIAEQVASSG